MTDKQLLQRLMIDFASGAALGGMFVCLLLFLYVQRLFDAVQSSGSPWTLSAILVVGCSAYFGFGAAITGFQFALMGDDVNDYRGPLS